MEETIKAEVLKRFKNARTGEARVPGDMIEVIPARLEEIMGAGDYVRVADEAPEEPEGEAAGSEEPEGSEGEPEMPEEAEPEGAEAPEAEAKAEDAAGDEGPKAAEKTAKAKKTAKK